MIIKMIVKLMLFSRRIMNFASSNRTFCNKQYVQTAQDKEVEDIFLSAALFIGGAVGATVFGYKEYTHKYNYKRCFEERVLSTTASIITGFGLGGFFVLLSPIILPVAMTVSAIYYFAPPTSPPE
jgi:hypothetical protein